MLRIFSLLGVLLVSFSYAVAQSPVDIGLFRVGNELEVRLKPRSDFDGIVSNVVFSLRWQRSAGVSLGAPRQTGPESTYIPIQRSGMVQADGPFDYQVYAGFGMDRINSTTQVSWRAGQEYVIARIPFSGNSGFTLASDTWTKSLENNGEFYISLGGHDRTGDIYKEVEAVADQLPFSIAPNPNMGQFTLTMPLDPTEDKWFELINAAGQVVMTERMVAGENGYIRQFDVRGEGAGVYHLRIHNGEESESHRIVVGN